MIDPDQLARLAQQLVERYRGAELAAFALVARRLAKWLDSEEWAAYQQLQAAGLSRDVRRIVQALSKGRDAEVASLVSVAAGVGAREAALLLADSAAAGSPPSALAALTRDLAGRLAAADLRILRATNDVFRQVIARVTAQGLTGEYTRRQAAQAALDLFSGRGITGFVDTSGRQWSLASYAEMACRTAANGAARMGALDRMRAAGHDLALIGGSSSGCELCTDWEGEVVSLDGVTPGYPTLAEAEGAGLFHPNCVTGDTLVLGPSVVAAFARRYEGELIVLETARGNQLSVTPNHPILTPEGWVAAGLLHEGDHVIRYLGGERVMNAVDPDDGEVPATIQQIAAALLKASGMLARSMPIAPEDFHGDGLGGEVDVVLADGLLRDGADPAVKKEAGQGRLEGRSTGARSLLAGSAFGQVLLRALHSTDGAMCFGRDSAAFLYRQASHLSALGLAATDALFGASDPVADRGLRDTNTPGDLVLRRASAIQGQGIGQPSRRGGSGPKPSSFAASSDGADGLELTIDPRLGHAVPLGERGAAVTAEVEVDQLVGVDRCDFSGHVYNLETECGWYACNSIVTHNCTHQVYPYVPGLTDAARVAHSDPDVYEARQQQRYLERGVRAWKMRAATSLDEARATAAQAKAREWQARLREQVDANGLKRLSYREQIGKAI